MKSLNERESVCVCVCVCVCASRSVSFQRCECPTNGQLSMMSQSLSLSLSLFSSVQLEQQHRLYVALCCGRFSKASSSLFLSSLPLISCCSFTSKQRPASQRMIPIWKTARQAACYKECVFVCV